MKAFILILLILFTSLCFSIELQDLRGMVDSNDDVQIFYREIAITGGMNFFGNEIDLKKLDLTSMQISTILEGHHSFVGGGMPHSDIDVFYDYILNDVSGFSTVNCGWHSVWGNEYAFIRIDSVDVAVWDDAKVVNIKCSNLNSTQVYATYLVENDDYRLINSTDGGLNWSSIEDAPNYLLSGVSPFNDQLLFYTSSSGELYRSDDGAVTSTLVNNSPQLNWEINSNFVPNVLGEYLDQLQFLFDPDEQHIFAVVKDSSNVINHLVRSTDNGFDWEIILSDSSNVYIDVDLADSGIIYKGVGSEIYKSNNYGNDFTLFQTLPVEINGIYQVDEHEILYAITDSTLYEITDSSITPLIDYTSINEEIIISNHSIEMTNYPNPFNPTTTISFSSTMSTENTELSIYNLKGQKVKQLVSDKFSAGQHSIVWNGNDDSGKPVSSGIYFYKLKSGNYERTRKMILLK